MNLDLRVKNLILRRNATQNNRLGDNFRVNEGPSAITMLAAVVLIVIIAAGVAVTSFFLMEKQHAVSCDTRLVEQIGATSKLCLHPLNVTVSGSNSSNFEIPVLVMKPGGTGSIEILYHLSAAVIGHKGPLPVLSSSIVPLTLSVNASREGNSKVVFSNGVLLLNNSGWLVYKYTVNTSAASTGYYAIEPPYYYGIYPALAVGIKPGDLNMSALSMWGFDGIIESGEFIVPSTIVSTSGFGLLNATVLGISYCPNAACVLISHSAY